MTHAKTPVERAFTALKSIADCLDSSELFKVPMRPEQRGAPPCIACGFPQAAYGSCNHNGTVWETQ